MGLLYKNREEIKTFVKFTQKDDKICMEFTCDGGKFGTEELLAIYKLSAVRLLEILSERNDYSEEEN